MLRTLGSLAGNAMTLLLVGFCFGVLMLLPRPVPAELRRGGG